MPLPLWNRLGIVLVVVFAVVGCTGGRTSPPTNSTSNDEDVPDLQVSSGEEVSSTEAMADVATEEVAAAHIAGKTAAEAEPNSDTSEVVLGQPELTAGIPGQGPLTMAAIEAWLSDAKNHQPLRVTLPFGLAAAGDRLVGLDSNPMTRAKIELGRQLYFDDRLSADNSVSCADCHHPDEGFAKHTTFGVGIRGQMGNRNSPVSYNRILSGAQFWDGRAASLEEQAIGPIANPIEMGNTHEKAVQTIAAIPGYQLQFTKIFPGEGVTIGNIGKAIATFERTIVTGPALYDYYEVVRAFESQYDSDEIAQMKDEDPEAYAKYQDAKTKSATMSESAKRGRELFFNDRGKCTACHAGANFTDEQYHNLGVGMDGPDPDLGRFKVSQQDRDRGAFKTPTVRNVIYSAPYMHDGSQKTLEEVVEWYDRGGHPNPYLSDKVKKLELNAQEKADLVEFMKALTGSFPPIESGRLPADP